jgi:hypothetical protein
VQFAERGERGERDLHEVADAANIDEDLIGAFVGETSAKLADHRRRVSSTAAGVSTLAAANVNGEWEKGRGSARMMAYVFDILSGLNRNTYGDEV